MSEATKAELAVETFLRRMASDGRVAWLLGPGSQTYAVMTEAYAETNGLDVGDFRRDFEGRLTFTPVVDRRETDA